jgi:hypothetical protein
MLILSWSTTIYTILHIKYNKCEVALQIIAEIMLTPIIYLWFFLRSEATNGMPCGRLNLY